MWTARGYTAGTFLAAVVCVWLPEPQLCGFPSPTCRTTVPMCRDSWSHSIRGLLRSLQPSGGKHEAEVSVGGRVEGGGRGEGGRERGG